MYPTDLPKHAILKIFFIPVFQVIRIKMYEYEKGYKNETLLLRRSPILNRTVFWKVADWVVSKSDYIFSYMLNYE